jgi:hypothetical protein
MALLLRYQGMCGITPIHTRNVAAKAKITDHQSTESFCMHYFLSEPAESSMTCRDVFQMLPRLPDRRSRICDCSSEARSRYEKSTWLKSLGAVSSSCPNKTCSAYAEYWVGCNTPSTYRVFGSAGSGFASFAMQHVLALAPRVAAQRPAMFFILPKPTSPPLRAIVQANAGTCPLSDAIASSAGIIGLRPGAPRKRGSCYLVVERGTSTVSE